MPTAYPFSSSPDHFYEELGADIPIIHDRILRQLLHPHTHLGWLPDVTLSFRNHNTSPFPPHLPILSHLSRPAAHHRICFGNTSVPNRLNSLS